MKLFRVIAAAILLCLSPYLSSLIYAGTVDSASLDPASAVILTGASQAISFGATNNKTFNIKTYHAEYAFTPGLVVANIVASPPATKAAVDTRKNFIILEWTGVAAGTTVTADFTVSSNAQGVYSVTPSSLYYTDYDRKTYGASGNSAVIDFRPELVPPSPPTNVRSTSQNGYVSVVWLVSPESDVASYNVYRATSDGNYSLVGNASWNSAYADANVQSGNTYFYKVASIDNAGNESVKSGETVITYIGTALRSITPAASGPVTAATGDINGDGKADLVVGYPEYTIGKGGNALTSAGKVDIYYGGSTSAVPDVTLFGEAAHCKFGFSLAAADMNNDGYDDLVIGAPYCDINYTTGSIQGMAYEAGKTYIYAGGPQISSTPAYTLNGYFSYGCNYTCFYMFTAEHLGYSLAAVGDINGDGYQDAVIGVPQGGLDWSGKIIALLGGQNLSSLDKMEYRSRKPYELMGTTAAPAGDVNNDGHPDIIAGAPADQSDNLIGSAYLIYGGASLGSATVFSTGVQRDGFGSKVSTIGDMNGDGYSDIYVGTKSATTAYVYYGGVSPDAIADIYLKEEIDFTASPGDIDKDGINDMLVSPGLKIYYGNNVGDLIPDIASEDMRVMAANDVDKDGVKEFVAFDQNQSKVTIITIGEYSSLPSIKLISPPGVYIYTNSLRIPITGLVTANTARLQIRGQDVQIQADGAFSADVLLEPTVNIFEIIATNPEGKVGKQILTVVYTAQPTPLTLSLTAPTDGIVVNTPVITVAGAISTPSARVTVNGVKPVMFGTDFSAPGILLQEGPNTVTATAQDYSGQTTTQSITVTLLTKGSITGTVTNWSNGQALPGATVTVNDSLGVHIAVTDAQGNYTIADVAQGSYTADFALAGYAPRSASGTIAAGQTVTLNAQLDPYPLLSVVITSPENGAVLNSSPVTITGTVTNNAQVTVNGVAASVSSGTFSRSISLAEGQNTITAVAADSYSQTASQVITVNLVTRGTLTGTVVDTATGLGIASATVTVIDSISNIHSAVTGTNGEYSITNLSPGVYNGTITLTDYSTYSFFGSVAAGETVTVNGSITLQAPAIASVAVSNITGNSVTIAWNTDQEANSSVEYGATAAYGSVISAATLTSSHSVTLNDLAPGATYHFRVVSTNSHSLSSSSADGAFTTVGPPVISNVSVGNITIDSATIFWTTDQAADSVVSYGTATAYGSTTSDPAPTTSHSITLTGLSMQTAYHFRVASTNGYSLSSSSEDGVFTTTGPIAVTIASPSDEATIQRPDIMVKGTLANSTGNETGVVVNGIVATVYGNEFVASHVPLAEGTNTITVNATDTAGYTATAAVSVDAAAAGSYITITSNIESGISPLETVLRIEGYAPGTTPSLSYLGPGSVDWTNCTSYDACKVRMTTEGRYYFTATGTGSDGNTYQDTVAITVFSRTEMDALLQAKWEGMKTALLSDNIEAAITYFVEPSKDRYRQAFMALGHGNINLRFANITELRFDSMYGPVAQCWALRAESGGTFAYPVTFVQDGSGVWKIMGF